MRITPKGQVAIPAEIRAAAGLTPNTEVAFEYDGTADHIDPVASPRKATDGEALVTHLRRHDKGQTTMTTDEIMALTRGE
jgi:AbrB family looped-hinge helix DNA binding protein